MNILVKNVEQANRAKLDLIHVFKSNLYINEKGYLQKLIDLLYNLGYYEDNESIFIKGK